MTRRIAAVRRIAVRTTIIVLLILLGLVILASFYPQYVVAGARAVLSVLPVITPPSPTIDAPQGEMPAGVVGLEQWVQVSGQDYTIERSSGFLLRLSQGEIVGVTTAHSLFQGTNRLLVGVGLGVNGQSAPSIRSDSYYGQPGVPFNGVDVSIDYAFLEIADQNVDPELVLTPDPRGMPQAGERVTLFSGLGDGAGGAVPWQGTILSTDPKMVMILMDPSSLDPGGMSGSPILSQHTGQVVGMAIGAAPRGGRWMIAIHPIGHLIQVVDAASGFPPIADYQY
jgi:hypothetical protein